MSTPVHSNDDFLKDREWKPVVDNSNIQESSDN